MARRGPRPGDRADQLASGEQEAAARRVYCDRFPLYDEFATGKAEGGPGPDSSFFQYKFFCFTPTSLKLLDELEFGDEQLIVAEVTPTS